MNTNSEDPHNSSPLGSQDNPEILPPEDSSFRSSAQFGRRTYNFRQSFEQRPMPGFSGAPFLKLSRAGNIWGLIKWMFFVSLPALTFNYVTLLLFQNATENSSLLSWFFLFLLVIPTLVINGVTALLILMFSFLLLSIIRGRFIRFNAR